MTVIHQQGKFQLCHDGRTQFFRHMRGFGVWYRIPARCRDLKRSAFLTLREVVA